MHCVVAVPRGRVDAVGVGGDVGVAGDDRVVAEPGVINPSQSREPNVCNNLRPRVNSTISE